MSDYISKYKLDLFPSFSYYRFQCSDRWISVVGGFLFSNDTWRWQQHLFGYSWVAYLACSNLILWAQVCSHVVTAHPVCFNQQSAILFFLLFFFFFSSKWSNYSLLALNVQLQHPNWIWAFLKGATRAGPAGRFFFFLPRCI